MTTATFGRRNPGHLQHRPSRRLRHERFDNLNAVGSEPEPVTHVWERV